ncbi:MAG: hypothetical protein NVS1B5_15080 [Gemmatimonadaceae bacterium]
MGTFAMRLSFSLAKRYDVLASRDPHRPATVISSFVPAGLHRLTDPEAITPTTTLSALREKALAAQVRR